VPPIFAGLANLAPSPDINGLFTTDYSARQADGLRSAGHHEYNCSTDLGQQEDRDSNAS
jgi:hypothetical protein